MSRAIILRQNLSGAGGAESYFKIFVQGLLSSGCEVLVVTSDKNKTNLPAGVELVVIDGNWHFRSDHFAVEARRWCLKNKRSTDCVVSLDRNYYQDILRLGDGVHAAWLDVRRRAGRLHWFEIVRHLPTLISERKALCVHNTKKLWANSWFVAQQAVHFYGFPRNKIQVVYNGVDFEYWAGSASSKQGSFLSLPNTEKLALFVGSGWWRKGWDIAVRTIEHLRRKGRDIGLIGVGKPGRTKEFHLLGQEKPWCRWFPHVKQDELRWFYNTADCLVLPTRYDPFANVVLEALACGLPVLTSFQNGAWEICQGRDCARVCSVDDPPEAWANAMSELLDMERSLLSISSKSLARNFSLDRHIQSVRKILFDA